MNVRSRFSRHQQLLLDAVRASGQCTDESLAAHLTAAGEPTDRSTIVRWRKGERSAPLGLLPLLLEHLDAPGEVLDELARPLGLRVVADEDVASDGRGLVDRALEVAERSGCVVAEIRQALADGELDDLERRRAEAAVEMARRTLAELATVLAAS